MKKVKRIKAKIVKYDNDEAKYSITPKGCGILALSNSGIKFAEDEYNHFWELFCEYLQNAGYIKKE